MQLHRILALKGKKNEKNVKKKIPKINTKPSQKKKINPLNVIERAATRKNPEKGEKWD